MSYLFLLCFNYQNWLERSFLKSMHVHVHVGITYLYKTTFDFNYRPWNVLLHQFAHFGSVRFFTVRFATFTVRFDLWTVLFVSWTVRVVYCTVRFASCTVRFAKYTYTLCERFVRFNNEVRLIWTLWFRFIFF